MQKIDFFLPPPPSPSPSLTTYLRLLPEALNYARVCLSRRFSCCSKHPEPLLRAQPSWVGTQGCWCCWAQPTGRFVPLVSQEAENSNLSSGEIRMGLGVIPPLCDHPQGALGAGRQQIPPLVPPPWFSSTQHINHTCCRNPLSSQVVSVLTLLILPFLLGGSLPSAQPPTPAGGDAPGLFWAISGYFGLFGTTFRWLLPSLSHVGNRRFLFHSLSSSLHLWVGF